ncbi:hypothetical protein [Actinokineospora spheciospongiae]|uniref:hypothetical protein n=1 Tax=Actinokineospora spheciospongiae TaxID=909613 RepID=UPI000D841585|nr:hypothetical protein [Actinokineospora spheciospongiae]PWW50279.1 hypothetical protein DFQ13_12341 [Actinokineospora spheciospongiae]
MSVLLADPHVVRLAAPRPGTPKWTWVPRVDDHGVDQLDGVRIWSDYVADAVRIRSETDCFGTRTDPDGGVLWHRAGTLAELVDGLLELPAPGTHGAPALVIGRAPTLWTPGQGAGR